MKKYLGVLIICMHLMPSIQRGGLTEMNHSILTEFHDDYNVSGYNNSQHNLHKSQDSDLYALKLEAKIKELKANIRKKKPVVEQLKAQRKFLKKICEKQKQKIQGTQIQLIKNEYENQIEQLRHERHKLQDVITVIHQQSSLKAQDFVEAKQEISSNFEELNRVLQTLLQENSNRQDQVVLLNIQMQKKKALMAEIHAQIRAKQNVQKTYRQVMNQIQQIQRCRKNKK